MIKFNWKHLSDIEFEDMCKDILRKEGLENVQRMSGPGSGDMGRDLVAEETVSLRIGGRITFRALVQCKNYGRSRTTIDPSEVEKYAVRAETLGYANLLIITSHDLSAQAKIIAEKISQDPSRQLRIDFWTEADLVEELIKFPKIRDKYFNIPLKVEGTALRINGFIGREGQIYVPAFLSHEEIEGEATILFLVDTGATRTMITGGDAERFGLDFENLRKSETQVMGIGGSVTDAYTLSNVKISFRMSGKKLHEETLEEVIVIKPTRDMPSGARYLPSLLGLDILKKFRISFDEGTLEK